MDRNKWFSLNDGLEPVSEIRATNSGGQSDTALCKSDEDIPERTKVDSGDADRTETLFRSTKSFVSHTNPESAFDDRIIWRVPSGLQLVPHTTNNPVFSTTHSRKPLHHLGFSISGSQRELLDVAHEQYHKVSLTEDCGLCQDRSSVIMVKQHKKEQLRDKKDSTVGGYENTFIENLKGVKTKLFRNKSENLGTHQCINEVYLEDDGHGRKASENVYEEIDNSPPKVNKWTCMEMTIRLFII